MEQKKYLKIGSIVFFLILAAYSCWATAHSLHLLMPKIPYVLVWGITIAFFIVASYATKMMTDSLNQNIYQENRKGKLIGGIILLVIFWLICSMPTNTHTFFYNQKIGDVVTQDINVTQGYLSQLSNRSVTAPEFYEVKKQVDELSVAMNNEFNGVPGKSSGQRGNGRYVMECMRNINNILGCDIPVDPRANVYDVTILNRYNTSITRELAKVQRNKYQTQDAGLAQDMNDDLDVMADTVKAMVNADDIDEEIIKQTEGVLQGAYALIKNNSSFVDFDLDGNKVLDEKELADQELYTAQNLVTRTKRLLSVFDVWVDFLKGRYAGSGFLFWIVISILVDVAAFIFFDLAFKKEEY